jgi:hypothetical protein
MSKLLMIVGILLAALGVTTALMVLFSTGQMQVLGITPEVAATLLVGGFITLGLGGAVEAISRSAMRPSVIREVGVPPAVAESIESTARASTATAATTAAAASAVASEVARGSRAAAESVGRATEAGRSRIENVADNIKSDAEKMIAEARRAAAETSEALDRAEAQIEEALSPGEITVPPAESPLPDYPSLREKPRPAAGRSVPEPEIPEDSVEEEIEIAAPPAEPAEEEAAEDQLYVVEERMIRGRPARVLSDSTVEAETDEGWMRFENLEHLEEYLDAMSPGRA